uniref:uncharacterized protein LOC120342020 n=1 Tax=Styela clava TaxID=7725 RepID=UPI00193A7545|nr:uncharacterized protein LOC120342020 [Styela clava]
MKYTFGYLKSIRGQTLDVTCCPEYAIVLFAILDLLFCVPATAYQIIINTFSEETWKESHSELYTVTIVHMVLTVILGITAIGFSRCNPKVQTGLTITQRITSIMLLYLMKNENFETFFSITIWLATSFGITQVISEAVSLSVNDTSKMTERSRLQMFAMTWIPASIITMITTIAANFLGDENLDLRYFILYTLGMELLITISYYTQVISMASNRKDGNNDEKNNNRKDFEMISIEKYEDNSVIAQNIV